MEWCLSAEINPASDTLALRSDAGDVVLQPVHPVRPLLRRNHPLRPLRTAPPSNPPLRLDVISPCPGVLKTSRL